MQSGCLSAAALANTDWLKDPCAVYANLTVRKEIRRGGRLDRAAFPRASGRPDRAGNRVTLGYAKPWHTSGG